LSLTLAQYNALVADIQANTNTVPINGVLTQIKNVPMSPDNAAAVAGWYNQLPATDYFVWNSAVDVLAILNGITFTNYTPNDAPPVGPSTDLTYQNRAFLLAIKQTNLQLLFIGRATFDATRVSLRAALNDATTNLLSGTNGASRSGGWTAILPVLSRKATNAEKLFAVDDGAGIGNTTTDPRGASTNPDSPTFQGVLSGSDILFPPTS
jgi:hypothetical protein